VTVALELAPASELDSVRAVAPDAAAWLRASWDAAQVAAEPPLVDLVRARVAAGHGLAPEDTGPPAGGADTLTQAVGTLTDAFVRHVATRRPDAVAVLRAELGGRGTRALLGVMYVFDQAARLTLGHARLFTPGEFGGVPPLVAVPTSRPLVEANLQLHHAALRLTELDPVTTELVRLRAGVYHDCRTCLSMRLVADDHLVVGDALFARLGGYGDDPVFTPAQRAALRYADAHMTGPRAITPELRAELRGHFSAAQLVELSLDLVAWNNQKTLVALDLDAPVSRDSLTGMMVNADGTVALVPIP
jgi:alkylhydroperoxidase family enzyme